MPKHSSNNSGHQTRVMQSEDEKSPCHDSNTTTEKKDRPLLQSDIVYLSIIKSPPAKQEVDIVIEH